MEVYTKNILRNIILDDISNDCRRAIVSNFLLGYMTTQVPSAMFIGHNYSLIQKIDFDTKPGWVEKNSDGSYYLTEKGYRANKELILKSVRKMNEFNYLPVSENEVEEFLENQYESK